MTRIDCIPSLIRYHDFIYNASIPLHTEDTIHGGQVEVQLAGIFRFERRVDRGREPDHWESNSISGATGLRTFSLARLFEGAPDVALGFHEIDVRQRPRSDAEAKISTWNPRQLEQDYRRLSF